MFYPVVITIYFSFIALVVFVCHKAGLKKWYWKILLVVLFLLAPFWDILLQNAIMWNFARHNRPLQQITQTVQSPGSVFWIDTVWPGYDEYGRHWMVNNYLDGIHLQKLALNGDDGKIYLYQASAADFAASEKIRPQHEKLQKFIDGLKEKAKAIGRNGGNNRPLWQEIRNSYEPRLKALGYRKQRQEEIDRIFARPVVFPAGQQPPQLRYRIILQGIPLPAWQKKYVWCDEIRIHDNIKQQDIAFSKRCLGHSPKCFVNPITSSPESFYGGARLGDERVYEFGDKVLFGYSGMRDSIASTRADLERSTYKIYYSIGWDRRHKKQGAMNNAK